MKQLDLEDYIKEQSLKEKKQKPDWVNSSYEPIKKGDLVEYHFAAGELVEGGKKYIGLVLGVSPANVYESASCEILEHNGNVTMIETKWLKKIT